MHSCPQQFDLTLVQLCPSGVSTFTVVLLIYKLMLILKNWVKIIIKYSCDSSRGVYIYGDNILLVATRLPCGKMPTWH